MTGASLLFLSVAAALIPATAAAESGEKRDGTEMRIVARATGTDL